MIMLGQSIIENNKSIIDNDNYITVGMGEIKISNNTDDVLSCLGIGSCIAVCAFDPISKVAGMAHVVLPSSNGRKIDNPGHYADIAIPLLVERLIKAGALKYSTIYKLIGGAQMSTAPGHEDTFKTGEKNALAVKIALQEARMLVAATDLGGNKGRSVRLYVSNGKVVVRTAGLTTAEL